MIDPYNRVSGNDGARIRLPEGMGGIEKWVLTGGFTYMKKDYVEKRCRGAEKYYNEQSACFRAVHLPKYLHEMGIASWAKSDSSWTLGAVICKETDCLGGGKALSCNWRPEGVCLHPPRPDRSGGG